MKSSKLKLEKNLGQSLIEVLMALAIVLLVVLGLVKTVNISVKNENFSSGQVTALGIAQKKASEIVDLKNQDPASFFDNLPSYPDELINSAFCLKTQISDISDEVLAGSPVGAKMAKVEITVFWEEQGSGTDCLNKKYLHEYNLQTNVTN